MTRLATHWICISCNKPMLYAGDYMRYCENRSCELYQIEFDVPLKEKKEKKKRWQPQS